MYDSCHCFTVFNEKSDGLREIPHLLHLPLERRILSFIDFRFIILLIVLPQLPHTTSKQGYDIIHINSIVE
ncbi:MAG: hypothetical protein QOK72_03725 [Nitrososphaeraceae archaeon]|nr:hypothetical protein [Nitrososphaeraceae archaeon]